MGGRQLATLFGVSTLFSFLGPTSHSLSTNLHRPITFQSNGTTALRFPPIVRHHFFAEKETISFPFSLFIIYLFLIVLSLSLFLVIKTTVPFFLIISIRSHSQKREREKKKKKSLFLHLLTSRNCYCVPNLSPTRW